MGSIHHGRLAFKYPGAVMQNERKCSYCLGLRFALRVLVVFCFGGLTCNAERRDNGLRGLD
jgi:hypothetical protein